VHLSVDGTRTRREQSHVIIAVNGIGAKEAKQPSRTIPIIVVIEADPVGSGLIESLSRPGGNVTGLS
jgi:ABC-type uncharacterized transport system substrate-binding protein